MFEMSNQEWALALAPPNARNGELIDFETS